VAKKVFLTGGSGFIGTHLRAHLEQHDWRVFAPSTHLKDHAQLEKDLKQDKWDAVIHLAAVSAYNFCEANPDETFHTNVAGTALLARLVSRICPSARIVFASTAQVFNAPVASVSQTEFVLDESWKAAPSNVYPQSKLLAEKILAEYAARFGLKASVLRIFNHTHRSQSPDFFLPYIYSELTKSQDKDPVDIPVGNIDIKRDVGAVKDLVGAFLATLEASDKIGPFDIFNVCSGKARSLRKLAELLAQRLDVPATFRIDQSRVRPNEPASVLGSAKKLTERTGWVPSVVSDEQLIDSFLE
jgi:nucleoside-diphosphate-sugar epimerase